jgi:hypothetical protein
MIAAKVTVKNKNRGQSCFMWEKIAVATPRG